MAGVVTAVLALAALLAWHLVAAQAREAVNVRWSGPVECAGTVVESVRPEGTTQEIQAIRLREGMRCTLPVGVTNDSRFAVRVTRVNLPYMGPEGGAAVQVRELDGLPWARSRSVDAVFRPDRPLEPDETAELEVVFEFRAPPQGCTSRGLLRIEGLPRVTVLALGRPGQRSAEDTIGFRGTRESECAG